MNPLCNKLVLILIMTGLIAVSCSEDFLDQKPTSTLTELSYYQNVQELETGLVACYGAIGSNGFEVVHWSTGDIGSDDADKGNLDNFFPQLLDISYSRQNTANSWCDIIWERCYEIISRCNKVIDRSSGTPGDAIKIKNIVNQARFLRALSFYQLVTSFGDIPLVNRFLNPDEINLKRAPVSDIWAQIESDLRAATDLPLDGKSGRVISGAAYSLLGKVYLTQKKYGPANAAFYKVVSSNVYQLIPDFGFIFRYEGENCKESVFEIQHKNHVDGGNLGTMSGFWRLPADIAAGGRGFDCPTVDLRNEFEPGDPRIIYTFMFPGDVFPGEGNSTYKVENSLSPTGYNSRKAWIPFSERLDVNPPDWDINYRYMRYAEVLLLYAESLNEVNKQDSARMLVNMVRARARNTPANDPQRITCAWDLSHSGELLPDVTTNDQTELRQAIWHEQRVELAIEGHRRNMLLRTDRFKSRMESAKAYAGVIVEPHELLLPVPLSEIERSDNVLTQNPGY